MPGTNRPKSLAQIDPRYPNGKKFNFLFDTGAEATVIDNEILNEFVFESFSESKVGGPLIETQEVKKIILSKIKLGDLDFTEIGAIGIDLKFGKEKFCEDLHGILGSNLMKKSKWQIDYENQVIKISDALSKFQLGTSKFIFETKITSKGFGSETIDVTINGNTMPFNIDTGNGRNKMVANPKYYKKVIRKSNAVEFGFPKSHKNFYLIPDNLIIGGVEFSDQLVSLENEVGNSQLLGNKFFENFLMTIDWENHQLYLAPQGEIKKDDLLGFPLMFKPNYKSNEIAIVTGEKKFLKANNIGKGSVLSKVGGIDVLNLSDEDFCKFWDTQWAEMMQKNTLNITITNEGVEKEITLIKRDLNS
tara:strand:- start:491 stop:1573 length:1083 start_codon:yes stop_codon:yes gene_type:complete